MNDTKALRWAAMRAAFPYTIPIMTGFLFLGMAYGIYMNVTGFPWIYRMAMSAGIFAGTMEFVTVKLLLSAFDPMDADADAAGECASPVLRPGHAGKIPRYRMEKVLSHLRHVRRDLYHQLRHRPAPGCRPGLVYVVRDPAQSALLGGGRHSGRRCWGRFAFNTEGMDFVMTALLVVMFVDQWMKDNTA